MKRRHLVLAAAAAGAAGSRAFAQEAAIPGTIKYVVPFAPGGLTDVMARNVAKSLTETLKTTVIVENKAGGNAQIGAEQVAKGPADGSQILAITLTHAANVTLFPNAPYSFTKELRPVALLAGSPMLVVVPVNSPIKTLQDLIDESKKRTLNAGSSGNGTPPHLTMALFNDLNKSKMTHIPYRGGAPSMTDLIGGQLDVIFSNFPESVAHVKAGKLRALAICSYSRHPQVPDVPTTTEAGMPALYVENWTAVMAPAKTPDALVERYSREMIKIMYSRDMEEKARAQGFRINAKGSGDFAVFLKGEIARWARIIKVAKITPT
ncbi:MAG TPA: tripartite tricarboxylate transporter substrate-binding protein [Burkholderiaceae bacterium]|jgi:tripartite-type tricarboxylate transporter receptor subunit TctC|nr:tripartite tricarboxylate transporter substrate-binding protein [Burkholderiaceae bacterium]